MALEVSGSRAWRPLWALAVLAFAGAVPAAHADGWNGSVALTSDRVFRGLSKSNGQPALLFDLNHHTDTGWAVALGLARPGYPGQDGSTEATLALNRGLQLDPDWTLQVGVLHDAYLGVAEGRAYDYDEVGVSVAWQGWLGAMLAVSPNTPGIDRNGQLHKGRAAAGELTLHQRLVGRLAVDAGIGYYDLPDTRGGGYAYGSAGLSWGLGPVQAYLSRIDSQAAARGAPASVAGGRWVGSLLWSF